MEHNLLIFRFDHNPVQANKNYPYPAQADYYLFIPRTEFSYSNSKFINPPNKKQIIINIRQRRIWGSCKNTTNLDRSIKLQKIRLPQENILGYKTKLPYLSLLELYLFTWSPSNFKKPINYTIKNTRFHLALNKNVIFQQAENKANPKSKPQV